MTDASRAGRRFWFARRWATASAAGSVVVVSTLIIICSTGQALTYDE
jgi:hypothetical protein